jgi:hypothetical protein
MAAAILRFIARWRFVVHYAADERKTGHAKDPNTMSQVVIENPITSSPFDEPTQP